MCGVDSVVANIQRPNETEVAAVTLTDLEGDGEYMESWNSTGASPGTYYVNIASTDMVGNSGELENAASFHPSVRTQ